MYSTSSLMPLDSCNGVPTRQHPPPEMAALVAVIVFTRSVHRRVALAKDGDVSPIHRKMVALVSMFLWTTVAVGGRYIGFP